MEPFDFFKNPNLPLSVTLAGASSLPVNMAGSPNSEASIADDNDTEGLVGSRERRSTRVRREENVRLSSGGASVSVSADDRGESLAIMCEEAWGRDIDIAPDWDERLLQRDKGMERQRGDDGADAGADEGSSGFTTGASNET
jgi:hypothetical protein